MNRFQFCFQFQVAPLHHVRAGQRAGGLRGRAVRVDPIKPTLKALGINPCETINMTNCCQSCFNFAFKFSLRRYSVVNAASVARARRGKSAVKATWQSSMECPEVWRCRLNG